MDFYFLKAIVLNILSHCGIDNYKETKNSDDVFSSSLSINKNDDVIVRYGSIQKKLLRIFDIEQDLLYADFHWGNALWVSVQIQENSLASKVNRGNKRGNKGEVSLEFRFCSPVFTHGDNPC